MWIDNNTKAFLELIRAGLWEKDIWLLQFGNVDFANIYRLAEEQAVVGLMTAGLDHIKDVKAPQDVVLLSVGTALQLEQRNKEINVFVAKLIQKLRKDSILSVLVKGQGVALCYERPLWRTVGDVDLLLDNENYEKAKNVLFSVACDIHIEDLKTKHQALSIMGIEVELHGEMPFSLSYRADAVINDVINDSLRNSGVCAWSVNDIDVFIPKPDNHVVIVFTHFLHHFFVEGVGLRQICDWCRLLWTHKDSLNYGLLESRIRKMGLMTEWRAFSALAVNTLGMPEEAMPLYKKGYHRRGNLVLKRILKSGNFGHNHDLSYRTKYKGLKYQMVSLWRRFRDFFGLAFIFPIDASKFFVSYLLTKIR